MAHVSIYNITWWSLTWKRNPHYWPFVVYQGYPLVRVFVIGNFDFSCFIAQISCWTNIPVASYMRRHNQMSLTPPQWICRNIAFRVWQPLKRLLPTHHWSGNSTTIAGMWWDQRNLTRWDYMTVVRTIFKSCKPGPSWWLISVSPCPSVRPSARPSVRL